MEVRSVSSFLAYLTKVRNRTQRVVDLIPAVSLEWTYRSGKFTLGDLIRHMAGIERYMFAENVQGRPSCYPGHNVELAPGYDQTMDYFKRLRVEAFEVFSRLQDEDLQRPCTTPAEAKVSVASWLRAMVEHEVHHRGQVYLYLGMLGIDTPPMFGMTSEQVRGKTHLAITDPLA